MRDVTGRVEEVYDRKRGARRGRGYIGGKRCEREREGEEREGGQRGRGDRERE